MYMILNCQVLLDSVGFSSIITLMAEIPLGLPEDLVKSEEYQSWKREALDALEPGHPVSSRQRFETQDTHYGNPDMEPGVVRFRTESGEPFETTLVGEAEAVQDSRDHLILSGRMAAIKAESEEVKKRLVDKAQEGWRGTEFDDLNGIARALSAIPERKAQVKDRDLLGLTTGDDFPKVAETIVDLTVHVPEGLRVRGRVIQPEDLVRIINAVLEKNHLTGDWSQKTVITDLDVLRQLIELDRVAPDSVEISKDFTLRPDVLPRERKPKPQEPQE